MVLSILIVLVGVVVIRGLSVEQYPFLAPPNIRVTANYPGASAVAVEQSVATPIEQEVNGVENMIYMKSSNTSDGRMQLDVNFQVGVNQDMSNVLTQNRVQLALPSIPDLVQLFGIESVNRAGDHMFGRRLLAAHGSITPASFIAGISTNGVCPT